MLSSGLVEFWLHAEILEMSYLFNTKQVWPILLDSNSRSTKYVRRKVTNSCQYRDQNGTIKPFVSHTNIFWWVYYIVYTHINEVISHITFYVSIYMPHIANRGGCYNWNQLADDSSFNVAFQSCKNLFLSYKGMNYTFAKFHILKGCPFRAHS